MLTLLLTNLFFTEIYSFSSQSHVWSQCDNIKLHPAVIKYAHKQPLFTPRAGLFASAEQLQIPRYYSPLRIWVPLTQRHLISIGMLNLHRPQSRIRKCLLKIKEDRVRAIVVVPLWKSALGGFVVSEKCNFGWWHLFKRWGYTLVKPHWRTVIAIVQAKWHFSYFQL